jgi:hypothetical protein
MLQLKNPIYRPFTIIDPDWIDDDIPLAELAVIETITAHGRLDPTPLWPPHHDAPSEPRYEWERDRNERLVKLQDKLLAKPSFDLYPKAPSLPPPAPPPPLLPAQPIPTDRDFYLRATEPPTNDEINRYIERRYGLRPYKISVKAWYAPRIVEIASRIEGSPYRPNPGWSRAWCPG